MAVDVSKFTAIGTASNHVDMHAACRSEGSPAEVGLWMRIEARARTMRAISVEARGGRCKAK